MLLLPLMELLLLLVVDGGTAVVVVHAARCREVGIDSDEADEAELAGRNAGFRFCGGCSLRFSSCARRHWANCCFRVGGVACPSMGDDGVWDCTMEAVAAAARPVARAAS